MVYVPTIPSNQAIRRITAMVYSIVIVPFCERISSVGERRSGTKHEANRVSVSVRFSTGPSSLPCGGRSVDLDRMARFCASDVQSCTTTVSSE
jgi:hypothetical protein